MLKFAPKFTAHLRPRAPGAQRRHRAQESCTERCNVTGLVMKNPIQILKESCNKDSVGIL